MRYHNITKVDMLNGKGLRVVLWVSHCEHECFNCHNPQTWHKDSGIPFDNSAKNELFEELSKDYIDGITFSGGDPLSKVNREEIGLLIKEIKEKFPTKTIWLYTGYVYEIINDLDFIKYIDVLVDGRYVDSLRDLNLEYYGSSNQRVIDIKETIKSGNIQILR